MECNLNFTTPVHQTPPPQKRRHNKENRGGDLYPTSPGDGSQQFDSSDGEDEAGEYHSDDFKDTVETELNEVDFIKSQNREKHKLENTDRSQAVQA